MNIYYPNVTPPNDFYRYTLALTLLESLFSTIEILLSLLIYLYIIPHKFYGNYHINNKISINFITSNF